MLFNKRFKRKPLKQTLESIENFLVKNFSRKNATPISSLEAPNKSPRLPRPDCLLKHKFFLNYLLRESAHRMPVTLNCSDHLFSTYVPDNGLAQQPNIQTFCLRITHCPTRSHSSLSCNRSRALKPSSMLAVSFQERASGRKNSLKIF